MSTYLVRLLVLFGGSAALFAAPAPVTLREVDEVIPTYLSGPPDPNPMFYFGRQSQGAEGRIYPYPLYDNLTNQKGTQTYHLVYLENEYVKIAIAPEIGGRLFSALDKTNNYDFVYRQHVIKPALIGLVGAWISGGIEWNIPHHHRASTFMPVQYRTEENPDGSKTVWVGELEVRHRMRWAVGYTLHPGSSVLTCSVRIFNRTPVVNTMLCFANVAVNTNENYQIIFPPDTQWVTHHFKREFTQWPVARQPYGGVNWDNVDVSWYKNHQAANSMFAWNYSDDFYAGYDHGKQAGIMSLADHHIVPGKKFWTWGNGPRGRMWDDILTDTDGPYIELMVGAYFEQHLDAAVNVEVKDGTIHYGFYSPRPRTNVTARVTVAGKIVASEVITIDPAKPFTKKIPLPAGASEQDVRALLLDSAERELVAYSPLKLAPTPQPEVWKAPPAPAEFKSEEELTLAGQRIDQFHDPDRDPEPWWEEALKRDPGDTAAHTGLGLRALRAARYAEAEQHFNAAIARLTAKYTSPKNAEPFYYLGVALRGQGRDDEAYDAFFKATWDQEWTAPAYYALAEIASARAEFPAALDLVNRSLDANALNVRAYGLKSAVLRHIGHREEALALVKFARQKTDPLDGWLMMEELQSDLGGSTIASAAATCRQHPAVPLETAVDYLRAGLWEDAGKIVKFTIDAAKSPSDVSPLAYYLAGEIAAKFGNAKLAGAYRASAMQASPEYVFPFQAELIPVLRHAMEANAHDARAPYYLGNLLFDWQPEEAIELWEKSVALDPKFPTALRNLAQAYSHREGDDNRAKAIAALERAVASGDSDPTHFAELDQLYESAGAPPEKRLALLEQHQAAVMKKDEGLASLINLKTFAGKADEAIALLEGRTFSVWEGGTRFNTGESWTNAHLVRGLQRFAGKKYDGALADLGAALKYPANLRTAESPGAAPRQSEVAYWAGCVQDAMDQPDLARASWTEAAKDPAPAPTRGGGRGGSALAARAARYYQALALQKLGENARATILFRELVDAGNAALKTPEPNDSTPRAARQSPRARAASAHYLAGLGHAGLGEKEKAREEFTAALVAQPDHLGARLARERL